MPMERSWNVLQVRRILEKEAQQLPLRIPDLVRQILEELPNGGRDMSFGRDSHLACVALGFPWPHSRRHDLFPRV